MNSRNYEIKILCYETLFLFHTFFVDFIGETFAIIGEGGGGGGFNPVRPTPCIYTVNKGGEIPK